MQMTSLFREGALIKNMYHWLKSVVNICNTEVGTPFQRCTRVFGDAVVDCQAKLGPMFNWLCSIAYIADVLCVTVYFLDLLCLVLDFIRTSIGVIGIKLKEFADQIKTLFYVRIDISRDYEMETTQSKTYKQIAAEIVAEIQERVTAFMIIFVFIGVLFSTMFFNILIRIWCYKRKFLTAEHFDNIYITQEFIELDVRRAAKDMETLLPLSRTERNQYIVMRSLRLVHSEKLKLAKQFVIVGVASFKILTYLVIDYSLFWIMMIIQKHGRFKSTVTAPNMVGVHIEGEGILANLMRSVVNALKPFGIKLEIDTIHCLPHPLQPDLFIYGEILFLLALCWLLVLLEPYGLRLRAYIMGRYYPDRAKQRAVWLYNHILKSRTTLLKFIRRQLRHRFTKGGAAVEKVTVLEMLEIWFPWLRQVLGVKKNPMCLACARVIRESSGVKVWRCYKPGCPGTFCEQCFDELDNLCTLCMEPMEYGDVSDVSLEEESDDDDDEDDVNPFSQWRHNVAEEETELLPLKNGHRNSYTDRSYDYQEDLDHDPNTNKPPLVPVESHISLPRPVLSSTQLFNEPLPADYTSRRNELLEQIEAEPKVSNVRDPEVVYEEEINTPSAKSYLSVINDFLKLPLKFFTNRRENKVESEPLLQHIQISAGEEEEELLPRNASEYYSAGRDRTSVLESFVSQTSVGPLGLQPRKHSSIEEVFSQLVSQLEEEHGLHTSAHISAQKEIVPHTQARVLQSEVHLESDISEFVIEKIQVSSFHQQTLPQQFEVPEEANTLILHCEETHVSVLKGQLLSYQQSYHQQNTILFGIATVVTVGENAGADIAIHRSISGSLADLTLQLNQMVTDVNVSGHAEIVPASLGESILQSQRKISHLDFCSLHIYKKTEAQHSLSLRDRKFEQLQPGLGFGAVETEHKNLQLPLQKSLQDRISKFETEHHQKDRAGEDFYFHYTHSSLSTITEKEEEHEQRDDDDEDEEKIKH